MTCKRHLRMTALGHELFREWRDDGVLEHATTEDLVDPDGRPIVDCSDGHQKVDVFFGELKQHLVSRNGSLREGFRKLDWRNENVLREITQELVKNWHPCIHTHSRHGAVLVLSGMSKAISRKRRQDVDLLAEIGSGLRGKRLTQLALYPHAPCLFAFTKRIHMVEILVTAPVARMKVLESFPGIVSSIVILPHFDHGNGQRTTYKLNIEKMEAWQERRARVWMRHEPEKLIEMVDSS